MGKNDDKKAKKGDENIKVLVRCRPLSQKEKDSGYRSSVDLDLTDSSVTVRHVCGDPDRWTFDGVVGASFSQKDIFSTYIVPMIESTMEGFNATIFAYGQSGSGKTYTMTGVIDDPNVRGVIPRSFDYIFTHMKENTSANVSYNLYCSFLELYNGRAHDLLEHGMQELKIKETKEKTFYVHDLSQPQVKFQQDLLRLMEEGTERRRVAATDLNADSSRSHSIFTVYIQRDETTDDGDCRSVTSKLNLVDLAGSERQSKTGTTGEALKEGCNINLSLSALGTVIDTIVKGRPHIPYRSSPLTMLLKDSLGGGSKTCMFANINPSEHNVSETVSTLRFADRAKQIKNKPIVQMDAKDQKIADLTSKLDDLRERLKKFDGGSYSADLEQDNEALQARVAELEVEVASARDQQKREEEATREALDTAAAAQAELEATVRAQSRNLDVLRKEVSVAQHQVHDDAAQLAEFQSVFTAFIEEYTGEEYRGPVDVYGVQHGLKGISAAARNGAGGAGGGGGGRGGRGGRGGVSADAAAEEASEEQRRAALLTECQEEQEEEKRRLDKLNKEAQAALEQALKRCEKLKGKVEAEREKRKKAADAKDREIEALAASKHEESKRLHAAVAELEAKLAAAAGMSPPPPPPLAGGTPAAATPLTGAPAAQAAAHAGAPAPAVHAATPPAALPTAHAGAPPPPPPPPATAPAAPTAGALGDGRSYAEPAGSQSSPTPAASVSPQAPAAVQSAAHVTSGGNEAAAAAAAAAAASAIASLHEEADALRLEAAELRGRAEDAEKAAEASGQAVAALHGDEPAQVAALKREVARLHETLAAQQDDGPAEGGGGGGGGGGGSSGSKGNSKKLRRERDAARSELAEARKRLHQQGLPACLQQTPPPPPPPPPPPQEELAGAPPAAAAQPSDDASAAVVASLRAELQAAQEARAMALQTAEALSGSEPEAVAALKRELAAARAEGAAAAAAAAASAAAATASVTAHAQQQQQPPPPPPPPASDAEAERLQRALEMERDDARAQLRESELCQDRLAVKLKEFSAAADEAHADAENARGELEEAAARDAAALAEKRRLEEEVSQLQARVQKHRRAEQQLADEMGAQRLSLEGRRAEVESRYRAASQAEEQLREKSAALQECRGMVASLQEVVGSLREAEEEGLEKLAEARAKAEEREEWWQVRAEEQEVQIAAMLVRKTEELHAVHKQDLKKKNKEIDRLHSRIKKGETAVQRVKERYDNKVVEYEQLTQDFETYKIRVLERESEGQHGSVEDNISRIIKTAKVAKALRDDGSARRTVGASDTQDVEHRMMMQSPAMKKFSTVCVTGTPPHQHRRESATVHHAEEQFPGSSPPASPPVSTSPRKEKKEKKEKKKKKDKDKEREREREAQRRPTASSSLLGGDSDTAFDTEPVVPMPAHPAPQHDVQRRLTAERKLMPFSDSGLRPDAFLSPQHSAQGGSVSPMSAGSGDVASPRAFGRPGDVLLAAKKPSPQGGGGGVLESEQSGEQQREPPGPSPYFGAAPLGSLGSPTPPTPPGQVKGDLGYGSPRSLRGLYPTPPR